MAEPGVVVVGGGLSLLNYLEAAAKGPKSVTVVMGCDFLEWTLAAPHFIARPEAHDEFLCGNPEKYQKKGITYLVEVAKEVKPQEKLLICASGRVIPYSVLVVATGQKCPLFSPTPGQTLQQRKEEIKKAGGAIRNAKTVVVSGGGVIGLEIAGDIRLQHPSTKVVIVSRSGDVLPGFPAKQQKMAMDQLKKMNIDVVKGSVDALAPILEKGSLAVKDGAVSSIDFDVLIPSFMQGPNTDFLAGLPGVLNEKKQIQVNDFLQSTAHREIFTIGCGDADEKCVQVPKLQKQAQDVAQNVGLLLAGKPLKAHKDAMPWMLRAPSVKIGHGPGGDMYFDPPMMPLPCSCLRMDCCALPGFPFCPPPCCWCCCKGACMNCCGTCGGDCAGEPSARFYFHGLMKAFPKMNHYKGMGEPPAQQKMG
mmetsp:Transcript_78423/g.205818  ORF Transcript_78423/g.205818 Transcript_78423/m.205818 type:complete len:420 (-) Transcript_78423:33-1292(-)